MREPVDDFAEAVLCVVETIPSGRVMTYGAIAELLGRGGARGVGGVMARDGETVAWWRVVRANGTLPAHLMIDAQEHWRLERTPLVRGVVDVDQARWHPDPPEEEEHMSDITVYEKTTCTKCRELVKLLRDKGVDFERIDFHVDPLTAAQIADLLAKANLRPREVLRKNEKTYVELGLARSEHTDAELIDLMVAHPELLQRPIVVRGDRAVLARPTENVLELF